MRKAHRPGDDSLSCSLLVEQEARKIELAAKQFQQGSHSVWIGWKYHQSGESSASAMRLGSSN